MNADPAEDRGHRARRFTGRDPNEAHRVSTPLELLYDLTVVVAIGTAASELAHYLAEGHIATSLIGFVFAVFAVCWAWTGFTALASAYDTDDWVFRLATAIQMVGVVILALGLHEMFGSIDSAPVLHNKIMVAGYVVMRLSVVFLWLRAARHDPAHAPAAIALVTTILIAQACWVALAFAQLPIRVTFALMFVVAAVELCGPVFAQRRGGGTPWHAHHLAERYGLLVIITLGEGIIGTAAALNAVVNGDAGWSPDAVFTAIAGVGITVATWWAYFAIPWGEILATHRERAFPWAYGHLVIFGAFAAIGAGLHVLAYYLEGHAKLGLPGVTLTIAIALGVGTVVVFALYWVFNRHFDGFHMALLLGTFLFLGLAVWLATRGANLGAVLLALLASPAVTVAGYELIGHRHLEQAMRQGENQG